jgi:adenylate cyclase class 2
MSQGGREIEIKLAVPDIREARRRLRAAGFRISTRRVFERNDVFDTPGGAIRRSGRLVRVRQAGRTATLTYKGRADVSRHKSREEIETGLSDARAMAAIFERLGLVPSFRYEKFRTEYRKPGGGMATLDETPIGVFLELEGSPRWIDDTARKLGFRTSDYITSSYGGLYLDWSRRHGAKPSQMVFPGRPSSKH